MEGFMRVFYADIDGYIVNASISEYTSRIKSKIIYTPFFGQEKHYI